MAIPMDQARVIRRDPASLNLKVSVSGMSLTEAIALMSAMPAGAEWLGTAHPPQIGPPTMRYSATISNLSSAGARDLTQALLSHLEQVAEGGT